MSQRVLVFESDASFADEVKRNFERMGLAVDVAGDGPSGLELASARPPALILLAIELPGMNGFLVCKKIKKMAELEHVPLVIMSSEVDQETFEQHKKLRTRADEYVRKPIAFAELLDRIRSYVPANGNASGNGGVSEAEAAALDIEEAFSVVDDDVIVLSDDETQDSVRVEAREDDTTQADDLAALSDTGDLSALEEAADSALDAEQEEEHASLPSDSALPVAVGVPVAPPMAAAQAVSSPMPAAAFSGSFTTREPVVSMRAVPSPAGLRSQPPVVESAAQAAAHAAEIERYKRELSAAEEKVQAADRRASQAEQRAVGAEKALDGAKRTGGASSRELLDLREQINRKERELLELRDQVSARDKQLIEASDRSLGVERELQDARDKSSDLQRELEKKTEIVTALTADKEAARKRLDDAKARAETEAKMRAEQEARSRAADPGSSRNRTALVFCAGPTKSSASCARSTRPRSLSSSSNTRARSKSSPRGTRRKKPSASRATRRSSTTPRSSTQPRWPRCSATMPRSWMRRVKST